MLATIERVTFISTKNAKMKALGLFQAFQKVEIHHTELADDESQSSLHPDSSNWREKLQKIEKAQRILLQWQNTTVLERLGTEQKILSFNGLERHIESGKWKEICTKILDLDIQLQKNRTQRTEIVQLTEQWSAWENLSVHPREFSQMNHAVAMIGHIPVTSQSDFFDQFRRELNTCCYLEQINQWDDKIGVFCIYPTKISDTIQQLVREFKFIQLEYPYEHLPDIMLEQWRRREREIISEENQILSSLDKLSKQREHLELAEEYFRNLLICEEANQYLPESKKSFLLSGWIDVENKDALIKLLKNNFPDAYYLAFSELSPDEYQDAPVALKNGKIVSSFEILTEMYGMPSYEEVDPTPIMAPFYLIFFGMMTADLGYGLLLLIAVIVAGKCLKPSKDLKRNLDLFYYLSFSVIAWGIIYGSFFGMNLPFHIFSLTKDIFPILIQSLVFGWIQLMTGLAVSVYLHLRKKDVLGALSNGFSWMGLLIGLLIMVLARLIFKNQALFNSAILICSLSMILIVSIPVIQSRGKPFKGVLKGLYALYGATGYIGDLVSYTRLMALGIAGGSIGIAFNTIIASLPLLLRLTLGVILAVALHGLNMFLGMLSAYVHSIRLQYVELFGKFYNGTGRKFNPFKPVEKYIHITDEQNK